MKQLIVSILCLLVFKSAMAQQPEDSVKKVIDQLFVAMKSGDAKMLQDCFADSAILQSVTANGIVENENIAAFAAQIAKLPAGAADERIRYDIVRVDEGLAIAWTPYQFYLNGKFSHCGVDSFQLVRTKGRWKIQYLVDTRRKTGCQQH